MKRPDILKPKSPETQQRELVKIMRAMPGNMIERYMVEGKGPWTRWAVRFLNFYGQCPPEQRPAAVEAFTAHYAKRSTYLPPDLHIVEILWDFGKESEHFPELADLFHRLVQRYQQSLEPAQFQSIVVHRLQEGGIIPRSEWERYDSREQVPSQETRTRLQNVQSDAQRERLLLEKHQLPDDPDDMTHMLKKMKKAKMGLPHWPEFLAKIHERFGATEEWSEIAREIEKIKAKHPDWAEKQVPLASIPEIR